MNPYFLFGIAVGVGGTLVLSVLVSCLMFALASRRPVQEPARPIDPGNPPQYAVYVRQTGEPEETCTCHGRPLKDSEQFLLWPSPPERLCAETYKVAQTL